MLEMKLKVKGQVQGVGYRASIVTDIEKNKLEVVGYVKNLPDGTVEIVAQADIETLKKVRKIAGEGSARSKVRELIEEIKPIKKLKYESFDISF